MSIYFQLVSFKLLKIRSASLDQDNLAMIESPLKTARNRVILSYRQLLASLPVRFLREITATP
jgi:hypothetical protein